MRSIPQLGSVLALGLAAAMACAEPQHIELPPDTSTLRSSDLAGYTIALQKCGICHSADYISYQPPDMSQAQWTAEMVKMQHSYGAPLSERDIALIGAYLAVSYGSAKASDPEIIALEASDAEPAASDMAAPDIQALLSARGCLGCHATDKTVVGPAFRDVAASYRDDAEAQSKVATSIRSGGVGKWGQVPMPAMAGLSDAEAKALASFVLEQP